MNFAELKSESRAICWPEGEAENLVAPHDRFFNDALWDICKNVACYQVANTNVFPSCSTYFNCGMTVLPAPRGRILSVYTIGKDATTGLPTWCEKNVYQQVEYCQIERYVHLSRRCHTPSATNLVFASGIISTLFGCYRRKVHWPCPTDEGLEALPTLPQGFHYPQESTDAGGRARGGVWALYRGRIYIAPWIESTEAVVVEWNGIKTQWSDSDLVEDDAKFRQAVRVNVLIQHHSNYEENPQKLQELKDQFYGIRGRPGILQDLIHECREQTRLRACSEAGGNGSGARGIGSSSVATAAFYNEQQSFTANCPTGQTGTPVTATIPAGQVGSALSVADANAQAMAQAQANAENQLVCETAATVFLNTPQTYTATCAPASDDTPAATGNSVTVTIPAGQYQSTLSQAAADAAALTAATNQATSQLVCTFYNAPQTYTASCPSGSTGSDVEVTIPAGAYSSIVSQQDADAQALAAAQSQAVAGLSCSNSTFIIGNTRQAGSVSGILPCPNRAVTITKFTEADVYRAPTTTATQASVQLSLNQQAISAARVAAQVELDRQIALAQRNCGILGTGGGGGF